MRWRWQHCLERGKCITTVCQHSVRGQILPLLPADWYVCAEVKKVLKPDSYQEFELKEKTIISPNVAM